MAVKLVNVKLKDGVDQNSFVSEFDSNKITINGMDIDMSEVEGAYDSDYDNEMNPDKQELGVD